MHRTGNDILNKGRHFVDEIGRPTIALSPEQHHEYFRPILQVPTQHSGEDIGSYYRRYFSPSPVPPNHVRIVVDDTAAQLKEL